jgi:hypothetical protein
MVRDVILNEVLQRHQIRLEDVPSWEDGGTTNFTALLSRDYARLGSTDIHALGPSRDGSMEEAGSQGTDLEYERATGSEGGESLPDPHGRGAQAQELLAPTDEHETPPFELVRLWFCLSVSWCTRLNGVMVG